MSRYGKRSSNLAAGGKIPFFYALSLLFAGLYIFGHINQLQASITGSGLLNLTNILMCILGVMQSLLVVFMITGKKKWLKFTLYTIASLYLFGNAWIIKWLYSIIRTGEVSFNFVNYQYNIWGYLFNNTTWASSNADTLLFNYVNSVLWFTLAKAIDRDKKKSCICMGGIIFVTFILPIIFYAATRYKLIPEWWIKKSITLFISYISLFVIMVISTTKKSFWDRYVCQVVKDKKVSVK